MKVAELKELLSKAKKDNVEKIILECYKAVSKNKKEELDSKIKDIIANKPVEKKKAEPKMDINQLKNEIDDFISDVEDGYYFAPNRVVSKGERSKWRFKVIKYFKQLLEMKPLSDQGADIAADALYDLYEIICEACGYHIFRSDDPFGAIGWDQTELFTKVAEFGLKINRENDYDLNKILDLAINDNVSWNTSHSDQSDALITKNLLKKEDYDKALETLTELKERYGAQAKIDPYGNYSNGYSPRSRYEHVCEFIFDINVCKGNILKGFDTLLKDSKISYHDDEIPLYVALNSTFVRNSDKIWKQIYEYAVSKGIKPRKSLVEDYEELK